MNCWCDEGASEHKTIEKQLRRDRKKKEKEVHLVFFGKNGSGKSTVFMQLKILNGSVCSTEERRFLRKYIYQNVYLAIQELITAMSTLKIQFADSSNKELADSVCCVNVTDVKTFEQESARSVKQLWLDAGIQECYICRDKLGKIPNSAKYFLDDIERLSHPDYTPSEEDILRAYIASTGLQEYTFEQRGHIFRITDYKIQRHGLRRMWLQFFESIDVILYVIDISEYNKLIEECDDLNELDESKAVFKLIHTYPWFSSTCEVLFFNKIDLFNRKILKYPLSEHFPDFTGPKQDACAARNFIKQMFLEVDQGQERVSYYHFTCAIDRSSMKHVYDDVTDSIIQSRVKRHRLL